MKKNKLFKKLNGYQKAPRGRFLLLSNGVLTMEEFIVYELGLAITDWDRDHDDEIYGKFTATNKAIAELCGWKSGTTVFRIKKRLIAKGFFSEEDGLIRPLDFESWQLRKKTIAEMHNNVAKLQLNTANTQQQIAKLQPSRDQKSDYSLVSFKGNSGLSQSRTHEEYLAIWSEMGKPSNFNIDDMQWIDKNVKELPTVSN